MKDFFWDGKRGEEKIARGDLCGVRVKLLGFGVKVVVNSDGVS